MYRKKIAVRAMTAIAAGALLASNVMVAGATGTSVKPSAAQSENAQAADETEAEPDNADADSEESETGNTSGDASEEEEPNQNQTEEAPKAEGDDSEKDVPNDTADEKGDATDSEGSTEDTSADTEADGTKIDESEQPKQDAVANSGVTETDSEQHAEPTADERALFEITTEVDVTFVNENNEEVGSDTCSVTLKGLDIILSKETAKIRKGVQENYPVGYEVADGDKTYRVADKKDIAVEWVSDGILQGHWTATIRVTEKEAPKPENATAQANITFYDEDGKALNETPLEVKQTGTEGEMATFTLNYIRTQAGNLLDGYRFAETAEAIQVEYGETADNVSISVVKDTPTPESAEAQINVYFYAESGECLNPDNPVVLKGEGTKGEKAEFTLEDVKNAASSLFNGYDFAKTAHLPEVVYGETKDASVSLEKKQSEATEGECTVNFVDKDGNVVSTDKFEVPENTDDSVIRSMLMDAYKDGVYDKFDYHYSCTDEIVLNGKTITITVTKDEVQEPTEGECTVNFVDKDGNVVSTDKFEVPENTDDSVIRSMLMDAYKDGVYDKFDYHYSCTDEIVLNGKTITITVTKDEVQEPTVGECTVNFVDKDGNVVSTDKFEVPENTDDSVIRSMLMDAYKDGVNDESGNHYTCVGTDEIVLNGKTITITVTKDEVQEPTVGECTVNFVDKDGNVVSTDKFEVPENTDDSVIRSMLMDAYKDGVYDKFDYHYSCTDEIVLNGKTITITVTKDEVQEPTVGECTVNFVDKDGNVVSTDKFEVPENTDDSVIRSMLMDAYKDGVNDESGNHYTCVGTDEIVLNGKTITITVTKDEVQEPTVGECTVNFVDKDGNVVSTDKFEVPENTDDSVIRSMLMDAYKDGVYDKFDYHYSCTDEIVLNGKTITITVTKDETPAEKKLIYKVVAGDFTKEYREDDPEVSYNEDFRYYKVDLTGFIKELNDKGYETDMTNALQCNASEIGQTVTFKVWQKETTVKDVNVSFKTEVNGMLEDVEGLAGKSFPADLADLSAFKQAVKDYVKAETDGKYEVYFIGDPAEVDGVYGCTALVKEVSETPDAETATSTITIEFKYGEEVKAKQTITKEGKKVDTFDVKAADVDASLIPSDYEVASYFEDATYHFGDNDTLTVTLKLKDNGGNTNPGGGSTGGGSHSGGSSGGGGGSRAAAAYGSSGTLTDGSWKWLDDIQKWEFNYTNGTKAKNGWYTLEWQDRLDWYYFDADGYLVSGWYTDANGVKYYLHELHDGTFGRMYTGWNKVDGQWQHFNDNTEQGVYGAWDEGMPVPAELANL